MVSIPRSSQNHHNLASSPGSTTPTSPSNWEESLQQLSRELQVICRSPTGELSPSFTPRGSNCGSPISSSPRSSPLSPTAPPLGYASNSRTSPLPWSPDGKHLAVRHLMSEEKLKEKLYSICHGPSKLQSHRYNTTKKSKPVRPTRRKDSFVIPYFRATIDIGHRGVEDLAVKVDNQKLRIYFTGNSKPTSPGALSDATGSSDDLPAEVDLPPDVDASRLICIVKDGILEVRETRQSKQRHQRLLHGRNLHSLDLRRTLSGNNERTPIVIEDEGSQQFKLVLEIPTGYSFQDLKIKTLDDHLIVSGRRSDTKNDPCPTKNLEASARSTLGQKRDIFHVFQMPAAADPYSITAHLTEKNQLIIQAVLSARLRSNTL